MTLTERKEQVPKPIKLAVLISNKGTGTNLQAVIDAIGNKKINAEIAIVISDKSDAEGLEKAKNNNIPSEIQSFSPKTTDRNDYGRNLAENLNKNGVQVAILAGFSTILPESYFDTFQGMTLNIHPGLIPDEENETYQFPDGSIAPWNKRLMTEEAVSNFLGGTYAGSTIHVVTEKADFGPVLERVIVKVEKNDTVDSLYSRLKPLEHQGLISALNRVTQ